jgi:cobalt/nickel transport system permease protein
MISLRKTVETFEKTSGAGSSHPAASGISGKTTGFIERSLFGIIAFLKETISNDMLAAKKGLLQDRDPRMKCLSIVVLVLCVLISKNPWLLCALYAACLATACLSSIPPLFFLKRTLLFIPLFSLFIVIPAIFSFVTPGQSLVSFTVFSAHVSITRQGVDSALLFFFRVLTSVSLVILLLLTTRQHVLLKVLRLFKVPQVFVMIMGMSYRYIFLLLDIMQNTFIAVKSRVGQVTSTKTGRRVVGVNMASLWLRSYRLQSQVYDAMLSRGYSGADFFLPVFALFALAGTLWMNRFIH